MNSPPTHRLRSVPLPSSVSTVAPTPLPAFAPSGNPVDARACVEKHTGWALGIAWCLVVVGTVLLAAVTYGLSLLGLVAWPFLASYYGKRARAHVRGSGLIVGPRQLAPIHACVEAFSRRLGMEKVPEVYVLDESMVNAFAARFARKDAVLLTDEAVDACIRGGSPGALAFVIGHELGHIALGHSRLVRSHLRRFLRWLSRLDELSADRIAARLVGSREDTVRGMALLCAGPKLLRHVDLDHLIQQAHEVAHDKLGKQVEKKLTHPLTLHRLARLESEWASKSQAA